jgi:hypothetical protein
MFQQPPILERTDYRYNAPISVPFVASANIGASLTAVAETTWFFQQAQNSVGPSGNMDIALFVGSPVSGFLVLERENENKSIRYLTDLGNEKYSLAEVLTVAVEKDKEANEFVVSDPQRGWSGYGDTVPEAIRQFASRIVGDLEVLSAREGKLGDALSRELAQLRQVIKPQR